jgi:hypothetical protein
VNASIFTGSEEMQALAGVWNQEGLDNLPIAAIPPDVEVARRIHSCCKRAVHAPVAVGERLRSDIGKARSHLRDSSLFGGPASAKRRFHQGHHGRLRLVLITSF